MRFSVLSVAISSWLVAGSCGGEEIPVTYRGTYPFSPNEQASIQRVADLAVRDARTLLPGLPPAFGLIVNTGKDVIPETGETGSVSLPSGIYWTIDPDRPGGVMGIVDHTLRPSVFHELAHMMRQAHASPGRTLADQAIDEGLATVFERKSGTAYSPWADYPVNVGEWTQEFLALPAGAPRDHWMKMHPDGRRWIGYKVGTSLVERAMRATGRTVEELMALPTREIVGAALRTP